MEKSLFNKHLIVLDKQKKGKGEIIYLIKEKTGILLKGDEFILDKREIILQMTSVKRSRLIQKGILDVLKEKGYIFKN